MTPKTLIIVGTGIKFLAHLTTEAKISIEKSKKVFYLINDPAMRLWIERTNPNAESLDFLYGKFKFRKQTYIYISNYIYKNLERYNELCVVIYGHPTKFSKPALDAAIRAKQAGHNVIILPGISAEDCLFADLLINPGDEGWQSFDATDFIISNRIFDPRSHLILWQIGSIGELGHRIITPNIMGLELLVEKLNKNYLKDHECILYEAAQLPNIMPRIEKIALNKIFSSEVNSLTTLYIPPAEKTYYNEEIIKQLQMAR